MASEQPLIGITMGDPAGIGSEVIVRAYPQIHSFANVIVIGDETVMRDALCVCESDLEIDVVDSVDSASFEADAISVLDLGLIDTFEYGRVESEYGRASLAYIRRAIALATAGDIDAITTAPINKQATNRAGSEHAGHTGLLAEATSTENYSMMLVEDTLRVSHVSTHVPLSEAVERVTTENVYRTIEITNEALLGLGIEAPKIAVAGLNPHASDGGLIGHRDLKEIEPAIEQARGNGIRAFGPESPDTVYVSASQGEYDCVVSMYHDQGHIPIKMLGFQSEGGISGVNLTIGLPIIRTSVDHGTAFDIAGEGVASEQSMIDAVRTAVKLSQN